MTLHIQFALKNNPYYLSYIRENSIWYKILNRNPERFKEFEEKAKEYYHLRPADRIEKVVDTISVVANLMNSLK